MLLFAQYVTKNGMARQLKQTPHFTMGKKVKEIAQSLGSDLFLEATK